MAGLFLSRSGGCCHVRGPDAAAAAAAAAAAGAWPDV